MSPLQSIPPKARLWLYWVGYIVGMIGQGMTLIWGTVAAARPDVEMPLWLLATSVTIGFLQTQLNLLAGSNVPSLNDFVEGEVVFNDVGDAPA